MLPEHLLRKIDAAVDFHELYAIVEALYSEDQGRPNVDTVVLFKMVLIEHLYGLGSLRHTAEEVPLNVAYLWFLGYPLQEETLHFSTVSYNFRHRFTAETAEETFVWILSKVAAVGYSSIEQRPAEATSRVVPGHWEADTVVGLRKGKETEMLTLVERVTNYSIAIRISGKTSPAVQAAMLVLRASIFLVGTPSQ